MNPEQDTTLDALWQDQEGFNRELMLHSDDYRRLREGDQVAFAKDMILNLASEGDELLRTMSWKKHRKLTVRPNREHMLEEVVDQFKIWMTEAQGLGFTMDDIIRGYWRKSMVVRQRMSEEWVQGLHGPIAVVDIDQVLCDYITGITSWITHRYPQYAERVRRLWRSRAHIGADTVGVPWHEWEAVKHHFRSSGAKSQLPLMPGARAFLEWCRQQGLTIVLLTSRPIDRYPNIYTDTVAWLNRHRLPYDFIWWATDKGERIMEGSIRNQIAFVVDDDPRFVRQMEQRQIKTYWLTGERSPDELFAMQHQCWGAVPPDGHYVQIVPTLDTIMKAYAPQTTV